jgi:hypothetical protein
LLPRIVIVVFGFSSMMVHEFFACSTIQYCSGWRTQTQQSASVGSSSRSGGGNETSHNRGQGTFRFFTIVIHGAAETVTQKRRTGRKKGQAPKQDCAYKIWVEIEQKFFGGDAVRFSQPPYIWQTFPGGD